MSTLTSQLQDDMKTAMRAKEADRLLVIREILSNIKKKLIDAPSADATNRTDLDDAQVITIVEKMVKQRRDSIAQFVKGERPELAAKEEAELKVLQSYLPTQLTADEIADCVKAAINETQATTIKDMGKVMDLIRPKVQGRVDMAVVSQQIKQLLA